MHLRSPARDRLMEVLIEVFLSLSGPSRQIRSQTSDALTQDVKGPIILVEAGPKMLGVIVASRRREPL